MPTTARPVARRPLAVAILVALATTSALPAFAQQPTAAPAQAPATDAEAGTAASAQTLDTVTVTGSRIPRAGFDTLEPATVVTGESIRERGMINVADALNQTTGFGLAQTPEGTQGNYAVGVNFVNRFGLGSNRTLTLINGRRVVSSRAATNFGYAAGMQVDLNAIPAQLVDRVENLTIGGAPTYGSDAIAGTVNIILKDHYEGAEVNVNYGQTEQGNSQTLGYSFVFGQNFAGDRGNWVLSGNYANIEGLMQSENDFYRRSLGFLANSGASTCGPNDGRLDPGIRGGGVGKGFFGELAFHALLGACHRLLQHGHTLELVEQAGRGFAQVVVVFTKVQLGLAASVFQPHLVGLCGQGGGGQHGGGQQVSGQACGEGVQRFFQAMVHGSQLLAVV